MSLKTTVKPSLKIAGIALSSILLAACAGKKGPPTLAEISNEKKIEARVSVNERLANINKMKDAGIPLPQKVGLISFYLWDQGEFKYNAMARQYGGTYETRFGLTPKGANHFATKLAEQGVPALKKVFALHDMELLEPVEFVTTEEQKRAYVSFQLPTGKIGGFGKAVTDWVSRTPTVSSAAAGYNGIPAHLWMDAHGLRALEELRVTLGLDALVILGNTTGSNEGGVSLNGIQFFMYGANPVPKPSQKIAQIAYAPLMPIAWSGFGFGKEGWTPLAYTKKGDITHEFYEGYGKAVEVLADKALVTFEKQYGK